VVCASAALTSLPHHYAAHADAPPSIIAPHCQHLTFRCKCALKLSHYYARPRAHARDRYTTVTYCRRETLAPEPITRDNGDMTTRKHFTSDTLNERIYDALMAAGYRDLADEYSWANGACTAEFPCADCI
jgi:hypothetical protein